MNGKEELRKELLSKRREVHSDEKDKAIFEKLLTFPQFVKAKTVLTYVSIDFEVDTIRLIEHCFDRKIKTAVPGIVNNAMRFYFLESFGEIGEEVFDFDGSVCIVPGLAFDGNNFRLGYGGGYYDRFLRKYKGVKIGLCYKELIRKIPIELYDERVDTVIWS